MCGIVGYIGENQAVPVLLNGLSKLEYRGYDSAGISVYHDGIHTIKVKGKLAGLREKVEKDDKKSSHIGIGHTRWATHGVPNEINSHPHNSQNGKISVVHNGIIENYLELKNMLIKKGYTFKSETDTEVVAQLFEDLYDGDMVSTTRKLLEKIRGAYALGIMCTDEEEELIASFDVTLIRNTFADEIENPLYLCSVSSMKMTQKEGADVSEGGTATLIPDETITATFNGLSDAHTAEMTLSEGDIRAFQFDAESAAGKIISGLNEGDVVTFGYIVDKRNGSYVIVSAE